MKSLTLLTLATSLLLLLAVSPLSLAATTKKQLAELIIHDDGAISNNLSTTLKTDKISIHIGKQYGTKLIYNNMNLVGNATGAYASYAGRYFDLNYTSVSTTSLTSSSSSSSGLDVAYTAKEGTIHFVLFPGLSGFYSYFVNTALGSQGEFRTLYRLAPDLFPNGYTYNKDSPLPLLSDIQTSTNVQDETWQRADGSYITKYDNSYFMRRGKLWGVYGDRVGAFVIPAGGYDYYNGDQIKQELSVHRESQTGDAVLLNMLHGTHFQAGFSNVVPEGKVFGPWLVYLNDGSVKDAQQRAEVEQKAWPYKWLTDEAFQSRGKVKGTLVLDDGRPAAGAEVFLGDAGSTIAQGTTWQYTTKTDSNGKFEFLHVRTEKAWTVQAWGPTAAGGDVSTTYVSPTNFTVSKGGTTQLGKLTWKTQGRETLWRIGKFDRLADGFAYGGAPYTHGLVDNCAANYTHTIGTSADSDWCFGKSAKGTWTVVFAVEEEEEVKVKGDGVLSVSLAGFSGSGTRIGAVGSAMEIAVNGVNVGNHANAISSDPSLYRSGTSAGEWRHFEWPVNATDLKVGENTVTFTTDKTATRWRGAMWDAVSFEWA